MEVAADRVVDEALLVLRLISRLVSEHHIVVPPPLDLQTGQRINGLSNINQCLAVATAISIND